jgi:hypothetical protein
MLIDGFFPTFCAFIKTSFPLKSRFPQETGMLAPEGESV